MADVYKYVAADGRVYYTDDPKHNKYKLIIRSKPKGYQLAFQHLQKNKKNIRRLFYKQHGSIKLTPS